MIKLRRVLLAAIPLFSLMFSLPASATDVALAEALFTKGVADMEAGKYDSACPAIEESQRLDPRPGTLFTLADCQDKAGNIATASALYEDYLRAGAQMNASTQLRHAERIKVAIAQKAALGPEIPELTLLLAASTPKGSRVVLDGTDLTDASLGTALPIDPGEHVVTAQLSGGPVLERRIALAKGDRKTVELEPQPPHQEPVPTPKPTPPPVENAVPKVQSAPEQGMSSRRLGAFVAGGIGVVGLAVGGVTGAMALSKKATIDEGCVNGICTAAGKSAADGAQIPGLISSIGFGVGAVGLATGVVLWLIEPSASRTGRVRQSVTVGVIDMGPGGASVSLKGVF